MAVLADIENRIRGLEGGAFQELCDALLTSLGLSGRISVGRVLGASFTRRGTPDSIFIDKNHCTLVECTTQESGVAKKIKADISKCLDHEKTGIPVDAIKTIIICSSKSYLKPNEQIGIASKFDNLGIDFKFLGPHEIASRIYVSYPHLASDFLNVEVGSREVTDLQGFLDHYSQRSNGIPIDNPFLSREAERADLANMLDTKRVISITGNPGTGKTKLATYALGEYKTKHDVPIVCVRSTRNVELCDIERLLPTGKRSILFLDDVNKLHNLNSLMELIMQRSDITVVMTVRNYALQSLKEAELNVLSPIILENDLGVIKVGELTPNEVEVLARDSFEIGDPQTIEAITKLSKGNPRLAAMASLVAAESESLSDIVDASMLYESYFREVEDFVFANRSMLSTAALVALFSPVELAFFGKEGAILIELANLSTYELEHCVKKLTSQEILNTEQDKAAEISNQSLQTYILKRAFFDEEIIPLETLIAYCYPLAKRRIVELLNNVCSVFANQAIIDKAANAARMAWEILEAEASPCFPSYRVSFCKLKPLESLNYVRRFVDGFDADDRMLTEEDANQSRSYSEDDDCLSILRQLNDANSAEMSISLILKYFVKRPLSINTVSSILFEQFCMAPNRHYLSFPFVGLVLNQMSDLVLREVDNAVMLYSTLLKRLLQLDYELYVWENDNQISLATGVYPDAPEIANWRESCWMSLMSVRNETKCRMIDEILYHYAEQRNVLWKNKAPVVAADVPFAEQYAASFLDRDDPYCAVLLFKLSRFIENHLTLTGSSPLFAWRQSKYCSELGPLMDRPIYNLGTPSADWETKRIERIMDYASKATAESVMRVSEICGALSARSTANGNTRNWQTNATRIIEAFEKACKPDLFLSACRLVIKGELVLGSNSTRLVSAFAQEAGIEEAYAEISEGDFGEQVIWEFRLLSIIPSGDIAPIHLNWLTTFREHFIALTQPSFSISILDLRNFENALPGTIRSFANAIINSPSCTKTHIGSLFAPAFSGRDDDIQELFDLFGGNSQIVKTAYIAAMLTNPLTDYRGNALRQLLNLNVLRLDELLIAFEQTCSSHFSRFENWHEALSSIWELEDCDSHANSVMNWLAADLPKRRYFECTFLFTLDDEERSRKRNKWILSYIRTNAHDQLRMDCLFGQMAELMNDSRYRFYGEFIRCNPDIDAFKELPLFSMSLSGHPSFVPAHQARISFLEQVIADIQSVETLEHCEYLNKRIEREKRFIDDERLRDFLEKL